MFTNEEFEKINEELNQDLNTQSKKIMKVWLFFLLTTIVICGTLLLIFPNMFDDSTTSWILPVYGGIAIVITLLGTLISRTFRSEKPYFNYLFDQVIQKINFVEGLFLEYTPYDKSNREYVKKGGLFTSYATVSNKRHIKGTTNDETPFDIFDTTLMTSNGKSQSIHFDGVYYIIHKNIDTTLQVRSNGTPKLKGVKFEKCKEFENIKVFKKLEENVSNIDYTFINFVVKLLENETYKRVYLSVVEDEIHLAVWFKKHPLRKPKSFDCTILNQIANSFLEEIDLANEIDSINHF